MGLYRAYIGLISLLQVKYLRMRYGVSVCFVLKTTTGWNEGNRGKLPDQEVFI